jgi:hypothetical protein
MYKDGSSPAEILRYFALLDKEAGIPDLMQLMRDAFLLPNDSVQSIGGWWHDGSGELDDERLNRFLMSAMQEASKPEV